MPTTCSATCSCGWFGSASESDRLQTLIDEHVAAMPADTRHVPNLGDHPPQFREAPHAPEGAASRLARSGLRSAAALLYPRGRWRLSGRSNAGRVDGSDSPRRVSPQTAWP